MPVPTPRDMVGQGRETDMRLTLLERRLASAGVPERLGTQGQEVSDWNDARATGFYWSPKGALNAPEDVVLVGVTQADGVGNVVQTVHQSGSGIAQSQLPGWRRRASSTGSNFGPWRVIGSSDALTDPIWVYGPSSVSLTGGAASWQLISGTTTIYRPRRDLWVDVEASAIMKASTGYSMLGINITGGRTVSTDEAPDNSMASSSWTPFTSSTVDTSVKTPVKRLLLPGGVDTNFMIYARRNVGSGTHTCNYSLLTLRPVKWGY